MVRGEKAGGKRNQRKRVKSGEKGSDDSDEDYVISEPETDASEDVLEDLDVSALEDGLDNSDEDEIEVDVKDREYEVGEDEEDRKSISRPRSSHGRKANGKSLQNGTVSARHCLDNFEVEGEEDEEEEKEDEEDPIIPCTRPRSSRCRKANKQSLEQDASVSIKHDLNNLDEVEAELEDKEESEKEEHHKDEGADSRNSRSRSRSPGGQKTDDKSLQKNRPASKKEDDDDEEYVVNDEDEEDDDDDDEFTAEDEDDDDCLDDEEESPEEKGTESEFGTHKSAFKKKASQRDGIRKKGLKVSRKAPKKSGTKQIRLQKKAKLENAIAGESGGGFLDEDAHWRRTCRKNTGRRKRRFGTSSDSDFMASGSSDCEFTISEEEREQVKEANEFCGTLVPCTRKSSTSKRSVGSGSFSLRSSSSSNRAGEGDNTANQPKPTGTKEKEKVEEPNLMKQVCGICLSEEDKRKVRGTLDCCSHYFCFTCIKDWSKVESRCPLCKQRFHTITKPARCNAGIDLRDIVLQVPERDQVYQPSEEEIRGYLDPYESVLCTECHQGGDDDLMLLCDLCDSPSHTFCVGLGREVPEGSWYCDGCRPGALGSLGSQSHDHLPNSQRTSSNLLSWTIPAAGFSEGFDLNAPPSTHVLNLPSPRFPLGFSQSLSPLSGAQASTLSGRRMIHRHIQLRNGMSPRTDGSSTSILRIEPQPYPVRQSRLATLRSMGMETMALNNISSSGVLMQGISFPALQRIEGLFTAPSTSGRRLLNGCVGMNLLSVPEQIHQSSIRLSISSDGGGAPPLMPEEQLQTMIKIHLRSLSGGNYLDYDDFKDIERSSIHTILAARGTGQSGSEASAIPPTSVCSHVNNGMGNGQTSLMKGSCSSCFDFFVREVVRNNLKAKLQQQWLSLGR
ncbi:hypothetical protein MLD38_040582 [Melastoma candidum]|nr:hypothetical protein MLD38_040582 [Melastoma candidum]